MGWRFIFLCILTVVVWIGVRYSSQSKGGLVPTPPSETVPSIKTAASAALTKKVQKKSSTESKKEVASTQSTQALAESKSQAVPDEVLDSEEFQPITQELEGADKIVLDEEPGTWHKVNVNDDGSFQAEYETKNGDWVREWYDSNESLEIEEIMRDDQSKITRWYVPGSHQVSTIQYDIGDKGGLMQYRSNNQPERMRLWNGDEPEQHVDF